MPTCHPQPLLTRLLRLLALAAACGAAPGLAQDFSVSPIRAELRNGSTSETITVTNHSSNRMKVAIRLVEWTQDEDGKDVYKDSAELVYFPRQMDLGAGEKKVVRVGMKSPPAAAERAFRLFIEQMPDPLNLGTQTGVTFNFRFGVPVFVLPPAAVESFEVLTPRLSRGRVSLPVRNDGNQHVRLNRIVATDGAEYKKELPGWYSLAGTRRDYVLDLPVDVCRLGKPLMFTIEGPGLRTERQLHVDPGNCS